MIHTLNHVVGEGLIIAFSLVLFSSGASVPHNRYLKSSRTRTSIHGLLKMLIVTFK